VRGRLSGPGCGGGGYALSVGSCSSSPGKVARRGCSAARAGAKRRRCGGAASEINKLRSHRAHTLIVASPSQGWLGSKNFQRGWPSLALSAMSCGTSARLPCVYGCGDARDRGTPVGSRTSSRVDREWPGVGLPSTGEVKGQSFFSRELNEDSSSLLRQRAIGRGYQALNDARARYDLRGW
jgi:hypothetical protein